MTFLFDSMGALSSSYNDFVRKSHQVDTGDRAATHGVHIAQRIGGADLSEQHGIVERWCDEVRSNHDGQLIHQAIDPRIVVGVVPDDEVGIRNRRQAAEQRLQLDRADLRCSAAGSGQSC